MITSVNENYFLGSRDQFVVFSGEVRVANNGLPKRNEVGTCF